MTEWLERFLNEPMAQNGWSLAVLLLGFVAVLAPLLVRMWRDRRVFGRRDKETTVEPTKDQVRTMREEGMAQEEVEQATPSAGRTDAEIDAAMEEKWKTEGIVLPDEMVPAPRDADDVATIQKAPFRGRMAVATAARSAPAPLISPVRIECEHCKGVGYVPGLNDLLQESIGLLGDRADEVVRLFYATLLNDQPDLAYLFPNDLVTASVDTKDSPGVAQREKLLGALVALAESYDPGDHDKMTRLTSALARFGRSHAAFTRRDGTVWGATLDEYKAVKDALFSTLVRVAGEHWKPEYTAAWSQAYDYAAAVMLAEQFRSGFVAPRFPRS